MNDPMSQLRMLLEVGPEGLALNPVGRAGDIDMQYSVVAKAVGREQIQHGLSKSPTNRMKVERQGQSATSSQAV
jgi:hypothetical protein